MAALADTGCQWTVLSLEITREELQTLSHGPFSSQPVVTVYAWPPLFTSRLTPKLQEERPLIAPRGDVYNFRRRGPFSCIYADEPMSWLGLLPTLQSFGYRWFMVDLSDGPTFQGKELERLLSGYKRARADEPYSLFNFDRKP